MQNQRFVFTLINTEGSSPNIKFGVRAKKWNQAKARVYNYALDHGFDVSDDSRLEGEPSNKPADHEIPEEYSVHNES